jgi:two-component system sensor histidine kinase EvgS
MPPARTSTRLGLFALLLSAIVLSLFGSLIAADRALSSADRRSLELDAGSAAIVAERELRLHEERLAEFFGALLPAPRAPAFSDSLPRGFEHVWVADPRGAIVWHSQIGRAVVDDSTVVRLSLAAVTTGTPRVQVVADTASDTIGVLLLAVPLRHRGARLGAAVGIIAGDRLLGSLRMTTSPSASLALTSNGRHLAARGIADARSPLRARARIAYPGDVLELEVAHAPSGRGLRTALWFLGVAALVGLAAALWRERRHAMSLAGRTTELERLYQEVARSNRMKSEFLANVSHELRTPLNAVVGFVEMLREGVYGELTPRQALPVDRIAASATHLRQLVDRLLDIAKIAAGRLEIHPEAMVLRPFVLNVASEMESLVSERGLALSIAVGPTLPRIRTDQTHLRQILINLIGNAVKYTSTGAIQVKASVVANGAEPAADDGPDIGPPPDPARLWVALQVHDTGIGIAAADRERIFDEFEQVNAGARTDSARRGTGLGLAISRRLARLLGGELTVVSEIGKGSTFTVWLPVEGADPKPD